MKIMSSTTQEYINANEEIKALKAQMINIAERHFNIRIREKFSTK